MIESKRFSAVVAFVAVAMGGSWAQNQTNITVQGEGRTAPATVHDTVRVVPQGTKVVPGGTGTVVVPDQAYTPPDTAREVGQISAEQTKTLQNRREAKRFSTAGFGPAGFGNIDERTPAYDIYAGRFWEVNKHAAIKALGEVASDFDRATMANVTLGANLYVLPTDISPYVGAGMGMGYGAIPGDRAFGFNIGASLGALLFRTSNAQMNVEGNAQTMLSELGENDENLSVYSARLGVLF